MSIGPNIWNVGEKIIVELFVMDPNTGTGLTSQASYITLTIKRDSDSKYWTGTTWSSTLSSLNMTESNTSNEPGRYIYTFSASANATADRYLMHMSINNPPIIEGDVYEVHVSRQQAIRLYESEAL